MLMVCIPGVVTIIIIIILAIIIINCNEHNCHHYFKECENLQKWKKRQ